MSNYKDYYKALGVERKATQEEIQRAYRKLARKYHPDINKASDSEDKFKEINEAYEVLGDPEKRTRYDQLGSGWDGQFTGQSQPSAGNYEYHFSSGDAEQFSDFFQSLFGGSSWRSAASDLRGGGVRRQRGSDHESTISITLADACHGAKKSIELERLEYGRDGRPARKRRSYDVTIPAGVTDGSLIRLAGQGGGGSGGGEAGDLFLRINILPDSRFTLDGYNLATTVNIAPWEAVLGAKVPVPTVDGRINLTVPAGSQSGRMLRVRGKGMPISKGLFGDLLVNIRIVVPERPSARDRHLFEELAKESRFDPRG